MSSGGCVGCHRSAFLHPIPFASCYDDDRRIFICPSSIKHHSFVLNMQFETVHKRTSSKVDSHCFRTGARIPKLFCQHWMEWSQWRRFARLTSPSSILLCARRAEKHPNQTRPVRYCRYSGQSAPGRICVDRAAAGSGWNTARE